MDIRMPGGDGIEATCGILGDPGSAGCRVLVLSMFELDEYVYGALRAGASGFLLKDCEPDRLLEAVRRIHDGESLFAPSVLTRLVAHYVAHPARGPAHPPARLTPREVEVTSLVLRGHSNASIATALKITPGTVKIHRKNIHHKLKISSQAELFGLFIRQLSSN